MAYQPQYKWVNDLPPCQNTGVGISDNNRLEYTGSPKNNEDRYFNGRRDNIQLCIVLDGHDGEKVAEFARTMLPGKLLSERFVGGPQAVSDRIKNAFRETETQFFVALGDVLMRKMSLQNEINARARNSKEAMQLFPQHVHEIDRLSEQIRGGTTVVLSLVVDNYLFIANVGDSRAILCTHHPQDGSLTADQFSDDHTVFNPGEQDRLANLGLNIDELCAAGRLGPYQVTRSIGDYDIKGGYTEIDSLSCSRQEPGVCEPFINGPWSVSDLQNSFLLLMSDGLYEAYGSYINTTNPQDVHRGIALIVADEMSRRSSVQDVAQATVDRIIALYRSCAGSGTRLDDITLIVNNFGHPLAGGGIDYTDGKRSDHRPAGPTPTQTNELVSQMNNVTISQQGGPSTSDIEYPSPVELTEEEKKSGKFITSYILFPLSFPYEKGLDEF